MTRRAILGSALIAAIIIAAASVARAPLMELAFSPTPTSVPTGVVAESGIIPTDIEGSGGPVTIIAEGLRIPWEIVFLPDGDMLVTERSGTIQRLGKHPATITVPDVLDTGEGGLMGMALHPQFSENHLLYLYFTTAEGEYGEHNRVARFRLDGDDLKDETIILGNIPSAIYHDGGRIAFGPDGMLYVTTGDANDTANAQDLGSLAGKTLRLTADGGIPSDNPFGTKVWSYGHRNSQGLAWDSQGRLWETEHGPSGGQTGHDELNLIEKGKNYGWPTIKGDAMRADMETPVINSGADETWAPAGAAYLDGVIYYAGLRGESLYAARINPDGRTVTLAAYLRGEYGRLRAVVVGPDGMLYVTTSNTDGRGKARPGDDRIIRVDPAALR